MRVLRLVLVVAMIASAVMSADVETETELDAKPKAKTVKPKTAPTILHPSHFMPKHRIIIVPKGDPRARAPVETLPVSFPPSVTSPAVVPPAFPGASTVLKAAPNASACTARKGTCKATTACTGGTVVKGLCKGMANSITCCVPKTAANTNTNTPAAPSSACPVYANAPISSIKGNGGKMYSVVRIAAAHFTGSKDNMMTKPTACAFAKMAEAAARAGHRLTINSGFRTYERQKYFWDCFQTKKCNNGNRAAKPGNSNHGRGQALDINTGPTSSKIYKWMHANAKTYGFRRTVSDEPWHWEL